MSNPSNVQGRKTGRVKFFNSQKGFGFIIPDDPTEINLNGRHEVFVHHTAIINSGGFKSLREGEFVEYELVKGSKGMQASNVTGPNGTPVLGDVPVNPNMYRPQMFYNQPYQQYFPADPSQL
jgi:cold shock CspA family protein